MNPFCIYLWKTGKRICRRGGFREDFCLLRAGLPELMQRCYEEQKKPLSFSPNNL